MDPKPETDLPISEDANGVPPLASGSASVALEAYRDLMQGAMPTNGVHYRRCIMLAVLIGRQIESDYRDNK